MCKLMANLCCWYSFSFSRETPGSDDARNWELMAELAKGDETALDKLITRWERPLLSFVRRQLSGRSPSGQNFEDDAEDITVEVFWRVYGFRHRVRGSGSYSAWIFRIAYNLCLDHVRKQKRDIAQVHLEDLAAEMAGAKPELAAPSAQEPDKAILDRELSEQLEKALTCLPESQRAALTLSRSEGLSYKEISLILGCSVASVESLLFRARENLRKLLLPYLGRD